MSGMNHPPVDLGIRRDISFERQLAEEAFEVLQTQGHETLQELDGYAMLLHESTMVDLQAEDLTDVSFRIKSVPTLLLGAGETDVKRPGRLAHSFYVMDIQHGTVSDEIEEALPEDYDWKSYVKVIVNVHELGEVAVLNGQTYEELSGADMNTALYIMSLIRHELRGMMFEDEVAETSENQSFGLTFVQHGRGKEGNVRTFSEFDSEDFMQVSECDDCCTVNQACEHNKFTLQ